MDFVTNKRISMKSHPQFNEKWLQGKIVDDASILGLGDLAVKDVERIQPRAGRLDLLLSRPETGTRFEVEIQLGASDESHIIRTIEYWDIERRRYPQYDHVAVIVAEDITSRFLNVIQLFNGFIPLVAIQVQAIEVNDAVTLVFTKVLDQVTLGANDDEDEDDPTDRTFWEHKSSTSMLGFTDQLFKLLSEESGHELLPKYNKHYIGVSDGGQVTNYVVFRPRKQKINVEMRLPISEEMTNMIEEAGMTFLSYNDRWGSYNFLIDPKDISTNATVLKEIFRRSRLRYMGSEAE